MVRTNQESAERTCINLLRYVLDHPGATCKDVTRDIGLSIPNVCRLVSEFKESNILESNDLRRTGKRGPKSQVLSLRPSLGCSIGIDLAATQITGLILDFGNNVTDVLRKPIGPATGGEQIVEAVTNTAAVLTSLARRQNLEPSGIGLALPGPLVDAKTGRVQTNLQFGSANLEFVPTVERASGVRVTAKANSSCFALGHYRLFHPGNNGVELIILNRFGIGSSVIWNGKLYAGASNFAGDLGLMLYPLSSPPRLYDDVCTGKSLLQLAGSRQDSRSFQELVESGEDPLVREWLEEAIPAFAYAIYTAIIMYAPDRAMIEGVFNKFPEEIHEQVLQKIRQESSNTHIELPEIHFFEGDDLMGARGAALVARDEVADQSIANIIQTSGYARSV